MQEVTTVVTTPTEVILGQTFKGVLNLTSQEAKLPVKVRRYLEVRGVISQAAGRNCLGLLLQVSILLLVHVVKLSFLSEFYIS